MTKYIVPFSIIFVIAIIFLGISLRILPGDTDNLIALSNGKRTILSFFGKEVVSYFPAYRPLPQLSIWLQYQFSGLNHVSLYFLFNLLSLIFCSFCLYILIYTVTRSKIVSLIASILFLLDSRVMTALIILIERQNTMAVIFGLIVILVILKNKTKKLNFIKLLIIYVLLLASFLSKEYGLAFGITLIVLAYKLKVKNLKHLVFIIFLSYITYFFMRYGLVGKAGSINDYCEDMAFFKKASNICYQRLKPNQQVYQHLYNIGASFVGTFFPNFFGFHGEFEFRPILPISYFIYYFIFIFIVFAIIKKFKYAFPLLLLIFFSACLSFMLYRPRNQLVGMIGVYSLFGIGLSVILHKVKSKLIKFSLFGIIILIIINYGQLLHQELVGNYNWMLDYDFCEIDKSYPKDIDKKIMKEVVIKYNIRKPKCLKFYQMQ